MTAPDPPHDSSWPINPDTRITTGRSQSTDTRITSEPPPPSGHSINPPPWTGRDILVALILVYVIWPGLSFQFVTLSGLATRLYDPDAATLQVPARPGTEAEAETGKDNDRGGDKDILKIRLNLWTHVLAFPLQALTIPVVFYVLGGVPPARIGLTLHRLGRNILSGCGAWLLITPLVFGINIFVTYLTGLLDPRAVQEHALSRLALGGATHVEWALIVFSAVVIAPVIEETVFRGMLQPWFAGFRNGGAAAMAAAFAVAVTMRETQIVEAFRHGGEGLLAALMPAIFVLVLVPFFLSVSRHPPRPDSPAVFGTALLFASVHAAVWPTPVPLFVLGLALGMLAVRTGSLIGSMVLHGLFNSVTCVLLLSGWVTG
jgi:membrane protease YdiL (CAAX protease family)